MAVRVLIVDDHQLTRAAISGVVRLDPRLMLVGQSDSGELALQAITSLNPDVVCLDVLMPGMDGLAVLQRIRHDHPTIRVVMITGANTADVMKKAIDLGAHGFVVKPFSARDVLCAIDTALRSGEQSSVAPS
jgi:two-component system, chemotaxis family, chemotaxis protein CheY